MVSAARRFGEMPTMVERLALLECVVAQQAGVIVAQGKRIAALEDQHAAAGAGEDGPVPRPLPDNWKPLPEAAAIAGFSWSGMRKKITTLRDGPWWKRRGNRILIDVTAMPRKTTV
jgi:hypothetical protein